MIRNPRVMDDLHGCRKFPEATGSRRDDDREPHGCGYAFSDHKAVLATATNAANENQKLKMRSDL